jgi:hypothetical protein
MYKSIATIIAGPYGTHRPRIYGRPVLRQTMEKETNGKLFKT